MAEFRWTQMFLFLIVELQITAVAGQHSSVFVRDGDDVTLPCKHVTANQDKCDNTNWLYSDTGSTVYLVKRGQIHGNHKAKSDRLSVTSNCSLVIKKVTPEDVGRYFCEQLSAEFDLSVISMNKYEDSEWVSCSVRTYGSCRHTVKWLNEGHVVDKDVRISQDGCHSTLGFLTSHLKLKSTYQEIQCKVRDEDTKEEHLFPFSPPSSGDRITTTKVTTAPTTINTTPKGSPWWWYIIAAVGLAALLIIIVVVVIRWKKTTGNKTQTDEDMRLTVNPAVTQSAPETSQDTADPEDAVSYASVSYTKKTNNEVRVRVEDDGEGDAVTYSSVKASSSAAGASTDPNNVYATVN